MSQRYEYDEKTNSYVPIDETKNTVGKDLERIIVVALWAIQFFDATLWPIAVTALVYVYFKDKSEFITNSSKEVLNFALSVIIYLAVSGILILVLIGIPLMVLAGIYNIVVPILGILAAVDNKLYKAPFVFRFIQ